MDLLCKNILFTVAYYNALEYPLTTFEIWRHLFDISKTRSKASLIEVINALKEDRLKKHLQCINGFWFLKTCDGIEKERIVRQKISLNKIKSARKWIKLISWCPFLKGVFITGTLAMKKAKKNSDWDVLVVLEKNYIWLGRLLSTIIFHLIGKRRHNKKIKDRFCLNHFLSENGLILEEQSEFSASEVSFSSALSGRKIYNRFQQLNEFWVQSFKPNYERDKLEGNLLLNKNREGRLIQAGIEKFLVKVNLADTLNSFAKNFMIKKIFLNPKTYLEGADIRVSDQAMVFLPKPQREKIIIKTKDLLTKISR